MCQRDASAVSARSGGCTIRTHRRARDAAVGRRLVVCASLSDNYFLDVKMPLLLISFGAFGGVSYGSQEFPVVRPLTAGRRNLIRSARSRRR